MKLQIKNGQLSEESKIALLDAMMEADTDEKIDKFFAAIAAINDPQVKTAVQDELENQLGAFR